jgi:ABC-type uncharacterized transport system substrate-binding protein
VKRLSAAALLLAVALAPPGAAAHPHIFVDASARFLLDETGRLTGVRISHLYDPLVSLFVLQDLGFDPFAPLDGAEADLLAAEQRQLLDASNGFAALSIGGEDLMTDPAQDIRAAIEAERMRVDFTLPLTRPAELDGLDARLAIYDPVYFIAFDLTGAVTVEGGSGCVATPVDQALSAGLLALQARLAEIPADGIPDDPTVGRLFAAQARLSCP